VDSLSRIKVALVIPTLDQSGAEKQLTLLAQGLPTDRFVPHVFALTRGGPYEAALQQAGVPVTVIGKRWKFDPWAARRLKHALQQFAPDVVHSWLFAANAYTRLALGSHPPWPIIVSERCVDSWKAGWQLWLDRRLISRTTRLVGNSPSVVDFYRHVGYPPDRLAMIPNGVTPVETTPALRTQLRQQLGLHDDVFLVVSIGRLAMQKRVKDAMWAVETLRQSRPQLHLVIVGDGPERQRLEEYSRAIQVTDHAHFVGHQARATEWLSAADAFVLASSFEGMSNSLMEAMSAAVPVVVSDIPANTELVTHRETGLLFKPGDTVGIMQALRCLIDEPALRTQLAHAAREHIVRQFSVEQMVTRYADLYRDLIAPAARR
jgi:glycosyltransferase involved in cell wall biosynthesis